MSRNFWNNEYSKPTHIAMSDEPSSDMIHFLKWLDRNDHDFSLNKNSLILDLGCGNGRNLFYLRENFNTKVVGFDKSSEAVALAKKRLKSVASKPNMPHPDIVLEVRDISRPLPLEDDSADLVLDMMTSHFLKEKERVLLRDEIVRVLRPGGWLFFKTFLADGDLHTRRLLRDHPADEPGAYIHPKIGQYEYVWREDDIYDFFRPYFDIEKAERSHKHIKDGKAFKRRTISVFLKKL